MTKRISVVIKPASGEPKPVLHTLNSVKSSRRQPLVRRAWGEHDRGSQCVVLSGRTYCDQLNSRSKGGIALMASMVRVLGPE